MASMPVFQTGYASSILVSCSSKTKTKSKTMERKVFKIFGKVLVSNKPKVGFNIMNSYTMQQGIFVPEALCYEWLFDVLRETTINPNSTFYKSWNDVKLRTRWQLFLDQIRHYMSTYGTNFEGETWTMNDGTTVDFPFKELKVLEGITMDELIPEIQKLGYSNIAFSKEVLDFLFENKQYLEIDKIQNRTLKMMCIPDNYQFKNGQECLNWILWKFFNIEMLVKNKETFQKIQPHPSMLKILLKNREVLASVFYRNKDVFMQFKKCKELCHQVNVIRKLATKLHKPMKKSEWLRLDEFSKLERAIIFRKASIFKLVQMYNVLSNPTGYYVIRNGKAFYKETMEREVNPEILDELLRNIVAKVPEVEAVALPKGIELAMPTSEKNFIGDIPLGSYVECSEENTMIGIYWKNEYGARDLDLHVLTINGYTVGWYSGHKHQDAIIFSGDMTNAVPEATEIMWFKKKPKDSIVSVNEFFGQSKYYYDMFIAQEATTNFDRGYMVDPRNVIFKARMEFENKKDVTLGFFKDGKFIFHSCNVGNGIIPTDYRKKILGHLMMCKYLTLRDVLMLKGIAIHDDAEVKLNTKGDLINFFSL